MKRFYLLSPLLFACRPQDMEPFPLPQEAAIISSNIIAADFNQDGTTDLAATSPGGVVVLGQKNGALSPITSNISLFDTLVPVDLDGDLDVDIISMHGGRFTAGVPFIRSFRIALNRGDATFTLEELSISGELAIDESDDARGLEAADFDGDLDLDLLLVMRKESFVEESILLIQQADGTLTPRPVAVFGEAKSGDLNQDGAPDILVRDNNSQLKILFNQGGATFSEPVVVEIPRELPNIEEFIIEDLDGDQDLDIGAGTNRAGFFERGVFVAFGNDGVGGFSKQRVQRFDGTGALTKIAARDTDGDLLPELALAVTQFGDFVEFLGTPGAASAAVLKNKGGLRFQLKDNFAIEVDDRDDVLLDLLFEDLTGDSIPDLFVNTIVRGAFLVAGH